MNVENPVWKHFINSPVSRFGFFSKAARMISLFPSFFLITVRVMNHVVFWLLNGLISVDNCACLITLLMICAWLEVQI